MPKRQVILQPHADRAQPPGPLEEAFAAIREDLGLSTEYPGEAVAEAEQAAAQPPLPDRDETAVPFLTIDPPGSTDLDQAMCLERDGEGYRVRYAISAVADFVRPGGALDAETRRRGETVYFPDVRVPLHPAVLGEDAASLLPDQVRPAFVWDLRLDASGELTDTQVYRARVRSTARLDYAGVQAEVDAGRADEPLTLLQEIGEKRIALERARGGANLPMPDQEVTRDEDGYHMHIRPALPSEDWNAQISLLTGMAAARLMLDAKVGVLRTMPDADPEALQRFRRQAQALGVDWAEGVTYGDLLRTLDQQDPKHLALIHAATSLFRGAGYTPFDGEVPEQVEQAAVGAPYAHVTAPLRRLVDRFALVVCVAISAGEPVPEWAREALPQIPELMKAGDQAAGQADRESTDAVEAALLSDQVGSTHPASVVEQREEKVVVQLTDLPVVATCPGRADLGEQVQVRLVSADVRSHTVEFELVRGD